jgi:hypothetical protein
MERIQLRTDMLGTEGGKPELSWKKQSHAKPLDLEGKSGSWRCMALTKRVSANRLVSI